VPPRQVILDKRHYLHIPRSCFGYLPSFLNQIIYWTGITQQGEIKLFGFNTLTIQGIKKLSKFSQLEFKGSLRIYVNQKLTPSKKIISDNNVTFFYQTNLFCKLLSLFFIPQTWGLFCL